MPSWPCALHIRQWSHSLPSSRTLLCSHPCVCTDPFLCSSRQCYSGCGRESSAGPRDKAAPSPQRSIGVCSLSAVTVTHSPSGFRHVANDESSHRWLEKGMPRLRSHGYIQKDPHASLWPLPGTQPLVQMLAFSAGQPPRDGSSVQSGRPHLDTSARSSSREWYHVH